ncbi:MAG: aminofutalosine synthase MqnE [Verrucomicrobiae bacterium]|nr:aminofutalosine synthase MqnE [Verrucomicrobiae bacterium]
MEKLIRQAGLEKVAEKIFSQQRLNPEEALQLYDCNDLQVLGFLANAVRVRKNGNIATYLKNRYINYSNICILSCQFCSFARKKREPGAFEYAIDEMVKMAEEAVKEGATELHIVGGLHPTLSWNYYLEMLRALKSVSFELHLKIFTAIEIRHLAERVAKKSIRETLAILREHGLGSLTGGGAEIFDPVIRDKICRGKETAEEWLEVHRIWHEMEGRSTCTMLYGHVENKKQRVDHLHRLRRLQDETGGFTGFIPLPFQPEDNELSYVQKTSGYEDLKNLAVCRLYLDNIPHVTAYWIGFGVSLAQVALSYGADDLHGTIMEEKIFHMAGASSPQALTESKLRQLIQETGREPRQRDSFYRLVGREPNKEVVAA